MKRYNAKYLLGDIHGHWSVILNHVESNPNNNACYIQVGDFGIGFCDIGVEISKLSILNDALKSKESDLYVIRGNHDNPIWFKSDQLGEASLSNIFFVPDYTVLNIDSENILFIGGAISIDRNPRRKYKKEFDSWWEDEVVEFRFDKIKEFRNIDRLICHTCPDFCEPIRFSQIVYDYASGDSSLLSDLREERKNMTKLVTELMENNKLKSFVYGHFHNNYRFYHNECEFLGLGVDQFMSF